MRERIIFCAPNQFPQNYRVWNEFYLSRLIILELIKLDMNSMKRQKDRTLKDELPRSVGDQHATGNQWRNNSRKNEETESKQKHTQLWMWLVMETEFHAVKSNIA